MKRVFILFLIIIGSLGVTPNSGIVAGENITISKLDPYTNEWINVTITDRLPTMIRYQVLSSTNFRSNFSGELYNFNSQLLQKYMGSIDFYNLNMNAANPNMIISISSEGGQNQIQLNTILEDYTPEFAKFLIFLNGYHTRISGYGVGNNLWPVDMDVQIMESYSPQFGVSVIIRRGPDPLAVVLYFNLTLVVGNIDNPNDYMDLSWIKQAVENQSKEASIAGGGGATEVQFDTFSYGSADDHFNYTNTVFAVILEKSRSNQEDFVLVKSPGNNLHLFNSSHEVIESIHLRTLSTNKQISINSSVISIFIGLFVMLPILRRKLIRKNQ